MVKKKRYVARSWIHRPSIVHRFGIYSGLALILAGFFLPWLAYRGVLGTDILRLLPPDQTIAGWRVPIFARDVTEVFAVRWSAAVCGADLDVRALYLVYLSPFVALAGAWNLTHRSGIVDTIFATAHAALVVILIIRGGSIQQSPPTVGIHLAAEYGLWVAVFGHTVSSLSALRLAFARLEPF